MTVSVDQRNGSSEVMNRIETTSITLTSRGRLSLFVSYLRHVEFAPHLEQVFGTIRKSAKGWKRIGKKRIANLREVHKTISFW